MSTATQAKPDNPEKHRGKPPYAAFVLRCSIDDRAQIRGRLLDAESGISHPFADLDALPDLIRRLLDKR